MKKFFGFGLKNNVQPSPANSGPSLSASSLHDGALGAGNKLQVEDLGKLHRAAAKGNLKKLRKLAKTRDLNSLDKDNRTPLHLACASGYTDVVTFLVDNNCKLNLCDNENRTPLMKAVQCQQEGCAVYLLQHGADPNVADLENNTALHFAACSSCLSVAEQLLAAKANINAQNKDGSTPLMLAVAKGQQEMAEFLLEKGASVHICENTGRTPLMAAAAQGDHALLILLLNFDADPLAKDEKRLTAKHHAAINGYSGLSKLLEVCFESHLEKTSDSRTSLPVRPAFIVPGQEEDGCTLGAPATNKEVVDGASGDSTRKTNNETRLASGGEDFHFGPKKPENRAQPVSISHRFTVVKIQEEDLQDGSFKKVVDGASGDSTRKTNNETRLASGGEDFHFGPKKPENRAQPVSISHRFTVVKIQEEDLQDGSFKKVVDGASGDSTRKTNNETRLASGGEDFHFGPKKPENWAQPVSISHRFTVVKIQEEDLQDGSFKKGKAKEEEDKDTDWSWDFESISESPRKTTVDSLPTAKDTVHIQSVSGESRDGRLNDSQKPEGTEFREKERSGGQCNEQKGIKEIANDENKEKLNQKCKELEAAGKSGTVAIEKELAINIIEQKSEPKRPVKKNQYIKSGEMLEESQVKNITSSVKQKELVPTTVRRKSDGTVNTKNKMAYKHDQEKELSHKNQVLQDELAVLRFKLDQINVQHQEEAAKYLEENEALKLENAELQKELKLKEGALTQTVFHYRGQVNVAKPEYAMIISKLKHIKEDREQLEILLDSLCSKLSTTTEELESITISKNDLEQTLQRERDEWLRSKDKLQETNNSMSQRLSESESQINGLENELQRVTFALREKNFLIESIRKELSQAHCLVKEFENLLRMEKDQMNEYIIKLESTQEQLAQLQSENLLLRQQLEDFQNKATIKERVVSDIQDRFSEIFTKLRADAEKQVHIEEERNKELITKCNNLSDQVFKYEKEKVERELGEKKKAKKLEELIHSVETELDQERMRNSELQKENLGISKLLRRNEDKLKEYESKETVPQSIHQRERKKMYAKIDMEAERQTAEPCSNCLEELKVRKDLERKLETSQRANEKLLADAELFLEQRRKTSPLASSFASGSLLGSRALETARLENSRTLRNKVVANWLKSSKLRMEIDNVNKDIKEAMIMIKKRRLI